MQKDTISNPFQHEVALVKNFIIKERQERYFNLLNSKKGRIKFRSYISHFRDLKANLNKINITNQNCIELYKLLRSKGAPDYCYVISEHSEYDQKNLPLYEAIVTLFNSGISFFLSCLPGLIVYYEGEDFNSKSILIK